MKVKEILKTFEDDSNGYEIEINGKMVFSVTDGEPKDNNLARNFNDVYIIVHLLKMAYYAGKNGEEFELEEGN